MHNFNQTLRIQRNLFILLICIGLFNTTFSQTDIQKKWLAVEQKQLLKRVQSLGGWDVLRKDCASLAEKYNGEPHNWYIQPSFNTTNDLPASILALQPVRVEYYPGKVDSTENWFNDTDYRIIRITVFNRFYTGPGGSNYPPLGIDIICPPPSGAYNPKRVYNPVGSKMAYWHYVGLTTNVYEFYGFIGVVTLNHRSAFWRNM